MHIITFYNVVALLMILDPFLGEFTWYPSLHQKREGKTKVEHVVGEKGTYFKEALYAIHRININT